MILSKQKFSVFLCCAYFFIYLTPPLRNLSVFFPIFLVLILGIFLILNDFKLNLNKIIVFEAFGLYFLFILWVVLVTFFYIRELFELQFLLRIFYFIFGVLGIYLFLKLSKNYFNGLEFLLSLFLILSCLSSFSFFYQYYYGAISWFNDAGSPRGGVERYSSSFGSLTIYGTVVGISLVIAFYKNINSFYKFFIFLVIIAGCVLSMQKAALVNVIIASFFWLLINGRVFTIIKSLFFSFLLFFISYLYLLNAASFLRIYVDAFLVNTFGFEVFGSNVVRSDSISVDKFVERIFGYDIQIFFNKYNEVELFVTGIGALGAGSAMGIEGHQAHNSFIDMLFMGGIGFLFVFLFLFSMVQYELMKMKNRHRVSKMFLVCNFVFIINFFGASIMPFHPVTSFVFWLSFVFVFFIKIKDKDEGFLRNRFHE